MQKLALLLVIISAGCRSVAEAPSDMKAEQAYQTIANQLPRGDFGWGTPPGVAEMSASARRDRPKDEAPIDLSCNERGMKLVVEVFRPRVFNVKYDAIEEVTYSYAAFPNVVFCVILPFLQVSEARVVFDARKIDGLLAHIEGECERLEAISREIGVGGPYSHAEDVRRKVKDDAAEFGEGRLAIHFGYVSPVPPFIPYTAPARLAAEAFAWVKAHPNEKIQDTPKDKDASKEANASKDKDKK